VGCYSGHSSSAPQTLTVLDGTLHLLLEIGKKIATRPCRLHVLTVGSRRSCRKKNMHSKLQHSPRTYPRLSTACLVCWNFLNIQKSKHALFTICLYRITLIYHLRNLQTSFQTCVASDSINQRNIQHIGLN